jgi:hypothetical protein
MTGSRDQRFPYISSGNLALLLRSSDPRLTGRVGQRDRGPPSKGSGMSLSEYVAKYPRRKALREKTETYWLEEAKRTSQWRAGLFPMTWTEQVPREISTHL